MTDTACNDSGQVLAGIQLRDYQKAGVEEIRDAYRLGCRAVLFVLSTGGGKTVTFSYIVGSSAAKAKRSLVLVHREKLVAQASATFDQFGIEHGLIMSGRSQTNIPVQIGMVGTVARRLDRMKPPDFIVIDEAHHATASTYRKILDAFPKARLLGVTATPQRTDGTGLGDIFERMVEGPSMAELMERGALAPYKLFGPPPKADLSGVKITRGDFDAKQAAAAMDRATVTGDAVEHYRRLAPGKRALAFCVSREHARHVAETFAGAGIPAENIDGTTKDPNAMIGRFERGETLVLSSCDLISEGFDVPAVEAAILLRPTQSVIIYLQQPGRALRPHPGKEAAIILDHVGNFRMHGFPDDPRAWTLEGRKKGERVQVGRIPVTTCSSCFAAYRPQLDRCPHCGELRDQSGRTVEYVDGELIEITPEVERGRAAQKWMDAEKAAGRAPVLWPIMGRDPIPASLVKASDGGRKGFRIRFMPGAHFISAIFRPAAEMTGAQLRATGAALGYKPFWAARAHFVNQHSRPPDQGEITRAMAELSRSMTA
jgi:DNA repair protein RadD